MSYKLAKSAWLGGSKRRKTWIDYLEIGENVDIEFRYNDRDVVTEKLMTGVVAANNTWSLMVMFKSSEGKLEYFKVTKKKHFDIIRKTETPNYWADNPEFNHFKQYNSDEEEPVEDTTTEAGPARPPEPQDPREPLILSRPPSSRKRKVPDRHQDQEYTGSYDGKKKKTRVEGKKPVE
eukprot:SAG11_NODE_1206_length_5528_cov_20.313502_4_plen_178_part_00